MLLTLLGGLHALSSYWSGVPLYHAFLILIPPWYIRFFFHMGLVYIQNYLALNFTVFLLWFVFVQVGFVF